MRRNRFPLVVASAAVAMVALALATPANAAIIFDGFMSWQPTSAFNLATFDASGSDKLVVVATGEHNFPGNYTGNIASITYDGIALTKAVEVNPADPATGGHGQTATDIWYLDNPGAVYTSGALAASISGNGNNYVYTAIGLSGTRPGVGATATAPGAASVNLTTTSADSMVISSIGMGGQGNTASPLPGVTANSPTEAVTITGLEAGSNWAGHAVARTVVNSPGLQTFSFNTAKTDVATIAAEFRAARLDAVPIAGVDFEGSSQSVFDRNPDDLDPADGISVSSGNAGGLFDGWTLIRKSDNASFTGLLRSDGGATSAGATTPDYPARLESNSSGSWSITIPDDVRLDLDRIEFDVRAATGPSGRDGMFNTSLDGTNLLWENLNLPGRDTGWLHVSVDLSGALYQDLTDQMVSFNWMTTTSGAIDLDTIQVFGTAETILPEPSSFALAALGLLGLAWFGRRRRR